MTSCDTNILFAACNRASAEHVPAREFLLSQATSSRFAICEQVLMECYCLLRNPAASKCPLSAQAAASIIARFRENPHWRIVDVPASRGVMESVWDAAGREGFAFRKIFDLRLAFTLRHHGVTRFATRNLKDFASSGFERLFDPCAPRSQA
jgi:toxin-antitoxin system PIN domain toxin